MARAYLGFARHCSKPAGAEYRRLMADALRHFVCIGALGMAINVVFIPLQHIAYRWS